MSTETKKNIIVVVGPTASGKSDIAVALAKKFNGEVISADSRQVYKGMNLGTGKITKSEMKGVPHYILDIISPTRTYSAERFQKDGRKAIEHIEKKKKLPIVCGGTSFYIDSLIYGREFPRVKPDKKFRKEIEKISTQELLKQLQKLDARRAKEMDKNNRHRIIRALEIVRTLGKVPRIQEHPLKRNIIWIGISKSPEILKERIHIRLIKRLKKGMMREIQHLHNSGVSWKKLESFGLEYTFGALFLQKKITREEMIQMLEREINQYVKRQYTWLKKNTHIHWCTTEAEALHIAHNLIQTEE